MVSCWGCCFLQYSLQLHIERLGKAKIDVVLRIQQTFLQFTTLQAC